MPGVKIHERLCAQFGAFRLSLVWTSKKNASRNGRFADDDSLKGVVHNWLRGEPKTFYSDASKMLVERWEKCIQKQGDLVEKLCICYLRKISISVLWKVRKLFEEPSLIQLVVTEYLIK